MATNEGVISLRRPSFVAAPVALSMALVANAGDASAKKRKRGAKRPPPADAEAISGLMGEYRWGMNKEQVLEKLKKRVQEDFSERLRGTVNDPTKNSFVRAEMRQAIKRVSLSFVEFDGQTSGYDVSIVDREFEHETGESMLVGKDGASQRFFFFNKGRLYKMFVAFDKERIGDRTFEEFGRLMQAQLGPAEAVYKEVTIREEKRKILDHFKWWSKSGDGLRLVDRSAFYGVYSLVVFDARAAKRLEAHRRSVSPKRNDSNALVDSVVNAKRYEDDVNESIMDDIAGRKHYKPGEAPPRDIRVQSPSAPNAP